MKSAVFSPVAGLAENEALGIWLMIDGIISTPDLGAALFWRSNTSCQTCIHRKVCKFLHAEMEEEFSEFDGVDFIKKLQQLHRKLATRCGYFQRGKPRGH